MPVVGAAKYDSGFFLNAVLSVTHQDMAQTEASLLANELESIRNLSGDQLVLKFQGLCSSGLTEQLGPDFMANLDDIKRDTVYKCCLLLSTVTNGKKIPRKFQLEATLALLAGQDTLIHAATGSGKTLCMVLPALFNTASVSLVVSPLKRLQVLQVS
jgi:superfamily II DNA helicase RecQ